ncbi:MAG: hypothetical protein IPK16_01815 [Anaerolineales bacterium]|nr:hypothetical protein [Anaerolineales bacterium]
MRYARPILITDRCTACHTYTDRQLGDIGGAIFVNIPMAPLVGDAK